MNLLITNDDGFEAPGIQMLADTAASFGQVTVVAPANEQSGISHRITFEKPLELVEKGPNSYTVDGTPADCVRVAMSLWAGHFDWVLSGINDGANLGVDVFYSGTVAAAREANFFGLPSIALSQYRTNYALNQDYGFEKTKPLIHQLLTDLLSDDAAKPNLINVNLPHRAASVEAETIKRVRCDVDPSPLPAQFQKTDKGLIYRGRYADRPRKPGMDTDVCFGGDVSISFVEL